MRAESCGLPLRAFGDLELVDQGLHGASHRSVLFSAGVRGGFFFGGFRAAAVDMQPSVDRTLAIDIAADEDWGHLGWV